MELDSILKKIKKLQTLAERGMGSNDPATVNEAMVAAQRVQEILQEYNLEISQVDMLPEESQVGESQTERLREDWQMRLVGMVAKFNFCKAIRDVRKGTVTVVGRKMNSETVLYLFNSLRSQLKYFYEVDRHTGGFRNGRKVWTEQEFRLFYVSWYEGALTELRSRLSEQQRIFQSNPKGSALVVVNDSEIAKYIAENIGRTQPRRTRQRNINGDGFALGQKAARTVQMNKAIGSHGAVKQIGG